MTIIFVVCTIYKSMNDKSLYTLKTNTFAPTFSPTHLLRRRCPPPDGEDSNRSQGRHSCPIDPSTIIFSSISKKSSYTALKCSTHKAVSSVPHISRIECMESCGIPTSTVRMPLLVLKIGPIVLPHPKSERTTNSCDLIIRLLPISLNIKDVIASVEYR